VKTKHDTFNPLVPHFVLIVAKMSPLQSVQGHTGLTRPFNFWHSGTLVLRTARQSARISKN